MHGCFGCPVRAVPRNRYRAMDALFSVEFPKSSKWSMGAGELAKGKYTSSNMFTGGRGASIRGVEFAAGSSGRSVEIGSLGLCATTLKCVASRNPLEFAVLGGRCRREGLSGMRNAKMQAFSVIFAFSASAPAPRRSHHHYKKQ